ncbi:MAG: MBL fold metallo-hydrolase [bacterium]
MIIHQFFIKGIAHSSYLIGGNKSCAVVDPRRDISIYMETAKSMGVKITHILETHLHADFISGHLDLAQQTGAQIYAPKSAGCKFNHISLSEGDTFQIEDMSFKVLETSGHTPEHISYVVADKARGEEPVAVFCGDTLFVGDVGRPDLFPGKAQELASQLYDNLHNKLLKLPDFCEVYPAHGAGSLCGCSMGAKRTSTIGYEKKYNSALLINNKEEFIRSLTMNMPAAPDHFSRCSAINRDGPELVGNLEVIEALSPSAFNVKMEQENVVVLDIRNYDSFGGQHIPGSYHIDFESNFATFAGWIIPNEATILLVAESNEQAHEAVFWLRRVGLDKTAGYLDGGMFNWAKSGLSTNHIPQLSAKELHQISMGNEKIVIVDVRAPSEYSNFHIEGAVNIPVADLRTRSSELDPEAPTIVVCGTGHRSRLGASILKQHGFKEVLNLPEVCTYDRLAMDACSRHCNRPLYFGKIFRTKYNVIIRQLMLVDFTVVKIMLTAIITDMIGIHFLKSIGLAELHPKPGSFGASVIGGLFFGIGFGLLGYCPGTIAGAVGQGSLDALLGGVTGILLGVGIFSSLYRRIQNKILIKGDFGELTIPQLFHVNPWIIVLPVSFLLLGLLFLIEHSGL